MKFNFQLVDHWPLLAWCAERKRGATEIFLQHGPGVEVWEGGFCEAVWDGSFGDGGLDQTDVVFGSGGVIRNGKAIFVSSATTVDRLHWHESNDGIVVSNSLACLMTRIDAAVDYSAGGYFEFFESIIRGLHRYEKALATSQGEVQLEYYQNLQLDSLRLNAVPKPVVDRNFQSFAEYYGFLQSTFERMGENLADRNRKFSLTPLATISTGYDSTTGAAIGRHAGLKETISIERGRGDVDDNGADIARAMGLKPLVAQRHPTNGSSKHIPLYIASDAKGEDLYFSGSACELRGRFLITGYGGSRVWAVNRSGDEFFSRGDQSGLSHTEARLHIGYIHCPISYVGSKHNSSIRLIGSNAEMAPWSVAAKYNRPICRRIVEEAGAPREAFGQKKKAASVLLFDRRSFLPDDLAEEFYDWIEQRQLDKSQFTKWFTEAPRALLRTVQSFDPQGSLPIIGRLSREGRLQKFAFHEPKFKYLFPWALEKTKERYRPT